MYDYRKKDFDYEYDSSVDIWDNWYLKKLYSNSNYIISDYKYRNPKNGQGSISLSGKYARLHKSFTYTTDAEAIAISGDCDFNFNKKKKKDFKQIIERGTSGEKNELLKKLNDLHDKHHSYLNCSLMPTTGGINNIKGTMLSEFDRFDTFLYYLDLYYNNDNDKILPPLDSTNYRIIKRFLDSFICKDKKKTIYNFCEVMYNNSNKLSSSEKELINKLIINGSKSIKNIEVLSKYFELANLWWEFKSKHLK